MGELVEQSDNDNNAVVRVGEGHSEVSLKAYQDIYHQVTGRTEQIRQRYTDNLLIDFSELEQLQHKILQLCEVHNVVAQNQSISVFHDKERKEQFTSFERFRLYNSNASSPTISVVFKYNFSIIPANLSRPQEYVVTATLTSKVASLRRLQEDLPAYMQGSIFSLVAGNAAEITIDYADYVIARGYIEAFGEWVAGCKSTPKSKLLKVLRRHSHRIPTGVRLIVAILILAYALKAVPQFFHPSPPPEIWARFIIIYTGGAYILLMLARIIAEVVENAIDRFPELSYLNLNKGDEKLIQHAQSNKPRVLWRFAVGVIGAIIIGILTSKLEKLV